MLVNLSDSEVAAIGAKSSSEFPAAFATFVKDFNNFKAMAENSITEARIIELIKAENKTQLTEASVGKIVTDAIATAMPTAMTAWAGSESGKLAIGAEASKKAMEVMSATGTSPLKPSPAPAAGTDDVASLEAAGKYEEAYAKSEAIRAEFPTKENYAAFKKNEHRYVQNRRN